MAFAEQDGAEMKPPAGPSGRRPPSPRAAERQGRFSASRWLLTRGGVVELMLVGGMIAVVWCGIWLHLAQQRRAFEQQAVRDSGNLAQAAAESIGQTIAGVDDALRFMRAVYSSDPKHFDIGAWASRVNRTHGVALGVRDHRPERHVDGKQPGAGGRADRFLGRGFLSRRNSMMPRTGCSSAGRSWDARPAAGRCCSPGDWWRPTASSWGSWRLRWIPHG